MDQKNNLKPDEQEVVQKIKMYDVHSNKFSKIGWYWCTQTFQGVCVVEFPNKARYMYFPISQQVFGDVFKSQSKGQYFIQNIEKAPGVTYLKLGQPKMDLK